MRASGGITFQSFVSDIATTIAHHLAEAEARDAGPVVGRHARTPAGHAFAMDREKVVVHWPDLAARLSEEDG